MNIPKASLFGDPAAAAEGGKQPSSSILATAEKGAWVTCFGFPPGQGDTVLIYLQTMKNLPALDFYPKDDKTNNWVHIKLRSLKEAALALGENGRVVELNGTRVMLGVSLYPEGDQIDALVGKGLAPAAPKAFDAKPGSGPKRAVTVWEKASAWIMDM